MVYTCDTCKEEYHHAEEVVFDHDDLKTVDEQNPDWATATCSECFYEEELLQTPTNVVTWVQEGTYGA